MSEIISLNHPEALRLEILRAESCSIRVSMTIRDGKTLYDIELDTPNDLDVFTEIFNAQSIWVVKNEGQLEFGSYDFFVMVDATYDCRADKITVTERSE